jgi:hypothetical protein
MGRDCALPADPRQPGLGLRIHLPQVPPRGDCRTIDLLARRIGLSRDGTRASAISGRPDPFTQGASVLPVFRFIERS